MSQGFDFYDMRAKEAAAAADEATLENVRERNLRSAATWRGLADQAKRAERDRARADAERRARQEAERSMAEG